MSRHHKLSHVSQTARIDNLAASFSALKTIELEGEGDHFDARFAVADRPSRFFNIGRVFKTLWIEPAGTTSKDTDQSSFNRVRYGQLSHAKVRRFVVIRKRLHSCLCLAISTYGGHGASKAQGRPQDHAIVYASSDLIPPLLPEEEIILDAFPIIVEESGEVLEPTSRLDFGKIYTVEHNVKVMRIGRIAPDQISRLQLYFSDIMGFTQQQTITRPLSTVPFARDMDFTGRQDVMALLDAKLTPAASHERIALVGLGGVGKTQIAIEYSYWLRSKSPLTWIFWVNASNTIRFEESYRNIAEVLSIPHREDPKTDILKLVSRWLADGRNGPWILILDNADDISMYFDGALPSTNKNKHANLLTYIPQAETGSVLVTSRDAALAVRLTGSYRNIIRVGPMEASDALSLLKAKLISPQDIEACQELLSALDYLPLAITQAAAYISGRAPRMNVTRYLTLFNQNESTSIRLLGEDPADLRRDPGRANAVLSTWWISFDQISTQNPAAAGLLSLMSVLYREGIPESLLCKETDDPLSFETAVALLSDFSFITVQSSCDTFEMHRLVQLATRQWLEVHDEIDIWTKKALLLLSGAFQNANHGNLNMLRSLLPHLEMVVSYNFENRDDLLRKASILHNLAWYLWANGEYKLSSSKINEALQIRKQHLGMEDQDYFATCNLYGTVLESQGNYIEAQEVYREVLELSQKVLGQDHPSTLTSMNNLALVFYHQGMQEEAESMHRQVLERSQKALGQDHPATLTSMNNLALVFYHQGMQEEAESMHKQVMEMRKWVLGPEHPDTLASMSNLALIYQDEGYLQEAEELFVRALEIRKRVLGREHPDTLASMNNLASTYRDEGRLEEAEKLFLEALEITKRLLGEHHPLAVATQDHLLQLERLRL